MYIEIAGWTIRLPIDQCLSRHEYYQKPEEVVVTIFAKGIPAENVVVDFGEQIVCFYIADANLFFSFTTLA